PRVSLPEQSSEFGDSKTMERPTAAATETIAIPTSLEDVISLRMFPVFSSEIIWLSKRAFP
ncbi:hypothetical protein, partial [Stenotrophomonas maltophilia]|uniref:hypothetical protein n=1 Tax=Stenotrophomonas maltophilia TaxID=40324 RepID=UPI0019539D78